MITDETLMIDLQQIFNISQKYPKVSKNMSRFQMIPKYTRMTKDDQGWSRMIKELLWEIGSANASL